MSVIARGTTKSVKIVYPASCKEVTEDVGKDELVRRLKLIARAFQDMGQEDNEQYSGLALHLATDFFMEHSSKDVRLLVACCIADVFRVFAPEAPYRDASHIKDIFMFLIKQLQGLEDPNSPTFKRYFYLLENLAWVKSFNICIELEDSQEIFCSLFKLMFSVISDKHTSKVKTFMLDMMSPLLSEADTVSQELLDTLLIHIVEPHKSQNRVAFSLAVDLITRTSSTIEPYVQAFFNNALMLGKTSESELSEHLYDLIYELNTIAPAVLLAVLPQLEFKLKSNEESERKAVTKILSKMFSDQGSNLAEQNKPLWNCFLGRFNDISISVRSTCVLSAVNFVLYHPELTKEVIEQVKIRQHDAEETVRNDVVGALLAIARKSFEIMSDDMLEVIKERTRDKKYKIRREALNGLGQLYREVVGTGKYSQTEENKLLFVKDKVFHAYYQQNQEDRLLVERVFNMFLVPYTLSVTERMKRLYLLYATLDEPAAKAFVEMMRHRHMVRMCVKYLLDAHDRMTANPKDHVAILPKLQQIARTLSEPQKAMEHLKKFNDMLRDDRRLRSLMRYLISPDCNCRKANENVKEILKKLGGGTANSAQAQILLYNMVKSLLERVAPVMVDAQAIDVLVKHIDDAVRRQGTIADGIDQPGEKGVQLLLCLSSVFPHYFKGQDVLEILISFLKDEDEVVADTTLQIFHYCGQNLQTEYPEVYAKLLPILQHAAKIGSPKQAKHAIRCISKIATDKVAVLTPVFEHVKTNINPESANYITSIVSLGHISQLCPEEFAQSMKAIVSKDIVKDLLMQDRTHGQPVMDSWYSDHMVTEETQAKIQAMKLLMRWLLGLKSNVNNSCTSTLRLLYTVIVHEGDLMEKALINKPELARLRLQAGCCIIKLMEEPVFAELLLREQFQALALLINDSCFHVRLKFAAKLHKGLYSLRLPLEYMSMFSLAANDPLRERRNCIKKFIQQNIQRRRDYLKQNSGLGARMINYLPEYVMPYTIHLQAHDPDLKSYEDLQALKNIKECLWFMMEPLVSRSEEYNYQYFRRLIENIKQTKDAQAPEEEDSNLKLYAVCDMALGLLQKNITNIVLKESNVDPVLPQNLFTKPDKSSLNTTLYLPKDFNFEKKKVMAEVQQLPALAVSSPPFYKGHRQKTTTTETIIVESPGPVVNPHPTCPREPREGRTPKKKTAKDDQENTQESTDGSTEVEAAPVKKVRGRGKKAAAPPPNEAGDTEDSESVNDSETSQDASVKDKGDSQESMDTTSESATQDTTADSEVAPSPPPKKRILKRSQPKEEVKKGAKKNTTSDSSEKGDESVTGAVKGRGRRGAGVVNGASGRGRGRKRAAAEEEPPEKEEEEKEEENEQEEEEEEVASPPRKKFNLEKHAVSSPKLGKKGAGNKRRGVSTASSPPPSSQETEEESTETSQSTTDNSSFKSPGSPAPKTKKGAAAKTTSESDKKSRGAKSKSPASSPRSSASSSPSPTGKKGPADRRKPSPVANVTLKAKNVRKTRPLSNGTATGSDTDGPVTPKKAAALSKIIEKASLGKKQAAKKPAARGRKK